MIELGPDSALTYSPRGGRSSCEEMAGNAQLGTTGKPEPELLADLDGERIGRAIQIEIAEIVQRQHRENTVNWCGIGAPNEGWARQVFGEPDVERLWEKVAFCMRLDEPDPVAAWREHLARLDARAAALTELVPDALHYRGPGHRSHRRAPAERALGSARFRPPAGSTTSRTCRPRRSSPRPTRAAPTGTIRSTHAALPQRPDHPRARAHVRGWADRRRRGGERGGPCPQPDRHDENADRLGELALVTSESRVGQSGTLFFDTLFDENATCHIAYGMGLPYAFEGQPDEGSTSAESTSTSWSAVPSSRSTRSWRTARRSR